MVQSKIIASFLLACSLLPKLNAQIVGFDYAGKQQMAEALLQRANRGISTTATPIIFDAPRVYQRLSPLAEEGSSTQMISFIYGDGSVDFEEDGTFSSACFSDYSETGTTFISNAQAISLFNEYVTLLNLPYTSGMVCTATLETGQGRSKFEVEGQRMLFGFPFGDTIRAGISATTGQLEGIYTPRLPLAPPQQTIISETAAATSAALAIQTYTNMSAWTVLTPLHSYIDIAGPSPNLPTQEPYLTRLSENQSGYYYHIKVADIDGYDASLGCYPYFFDVVIDGVTGQVVSALSGNVFERMASSAKATHRPNASVSQWNLGIGTISVSFKNRTLTCGNGEVEAVPTRGKQNPLKPISLSRGRITWNVLADPKTGIIVRKTKNGNVVGKANAPLLRAIREITR